MGMRQTNNPTGSSRMNVKSETVSNCLHGRSFFGVFLDEKYRQVYPMKHSELFQPGSLGQWPLGHPCVQSPPKCFQALQGCLLIWVPQGDCEKPLIVKINASANSFTFDTHSGWPCAHVYGCMLCMWNNNAWGNLKEGECMQQLPSAC